MQTKAEASVWELQRETTLWFQAVYKSIRSEHDVLYSNQHEYRWNNRLTKSISEDNLFLFNAHPLEANQKKKNRS